MRVALVFPPFSHRVFEEDLRMVSKEFGVYPPLGLAYAAAILERAGHEVILVDANALRLSKEEAYRRVSAFKPDLLGFMLTTYMFRLTHEWIKYFKERTGFPVVVGNINVALYPKETLSHPEIDYGIIGSAQESLPRLVRAIEKGKPPSEIDGVCYKNNGTVVLNTRGHQYLAENMVTLPLPARHLLPNDRYYQFISQRKNFTIIVTSVGCPSSCDFCFLRQLPYQERPMASVMEEVEQCYHTYGVREIDFFEPSLTINRPRLMNLCEELSRRKLDLHWSCRARVDQVDRELLKAMRNAGCQRIYYGVESGDQAVLDKEHKGITLDRIRQAIFLTKEQGIKSLGFLMVGQPGDTRESVERTIRFAIDLDLDYAQFCRTIAKPCSKLDEHLKKHTGKDYWREYVEGTVEERRLGTPWTELTEVEIKKLTKKAYYRFYYRPSYVKKALMRLRSWDELTRSVRTVAESFFF
jgi:radical SAM superfamily enzyme YgiQ (UPF0313 family)